MGLAVGLSFCCFCGLLLPFQRVEPPSSSCFLRSPPQPHRLCVSSPFSWPEHLSCQHQPWPPPPPIVGSGSSSVHIWCPAFQPVCGSSHRCLCEHRLLQPLSPLSSSSVWLMTDCLRTSRHLHKKKKSCWTPRCLLLRLGSP